MTIYKAFVTPHLDYDEVIYGEALWLLGSIGSAIGSSKEKLFQDLCLEFLQSRCWYRKIWLFYQIFKENKPVYFFNVLPAKNPNYNTRTTDKITLFCTKHNFFKNYFFPFTTIEWKNLDPSLRNTASLSAFKTNLLKFIRPSPKSVFNCHNCKGIKYFTRPRLDLSHFPEQKFKQSFQDTLNPFCLCGLDVEAKTHFFLYCPLLSNEKYTLLSTVNNTDSSLTNTNDSILDHILPCHKSSFDTSSNPLIPNATMNYLISKNRFE